MVPCLLSALWQISFTKNTRNLSAAFHSCQHVKWFLPDYFTGKCKYRFFKRFLKNLFTSFNRQFIYLFILVDKNWPKSMAGHKWLHTFSHSVAYLKNWIEELLTPLLHINMLLFTKSSSRFIWPSWGRSIFRQSFSLLLSSDGIGRNLVQQTDTL